MWLLLLLLLFVVLTCSTFDMFLLMVWLSVSLFVRPLACLRATRYGRAKLKLSPGKRRLPGHRNVTRAPAYQKGITTTQPSHSANRRLSPGRGAFQVFCLLCLLI